jgi:hypothetical protein
MHMAIPYMLKRAYKTLKREFAEDVVVISITETLDEHDVAVEARSENTYKAIPYSLVNEWGNQNFGEMNQGDTIFMFDHNAGVQKRDIIQYGDGNFKVKRTEMYEPRGVLICRIAHCEEL